MSQRIVGLGFFVASVNNLTTISQISQVPINFTNALKIIKSICEYDNWYSDCKKNC